MLKEIMRCVSQFVGNRLDTVMDAMPSITTDHIPDNFKDYLNKNIQHAPENVDKFAKQLLVRFSHA
jgi:hypothetical protein